MREEFSLHLIISDTLSKNREEGLIKPFYCTDIFPAGLGVEGVKVNDNLWLVFVLVLLLAVLSADLTWLDHRLGLYPGVQRTDSLQNFILIRIGNLEFSC